MKKNKQKGKLQILMIILLFVLSFCINGKQSCKNNDFKMEIDEIRFGQSPPPIEIIKLYSNADMEACANITGDGSEESPYILKLSNENYHFKIEVKNLSAGFDNLVIKETILQEIDIDCGSLKLEKTTTLEDGGYIKARFVNLTENEYITRFGHGGDLIIRTDSLVLKNNIMPENKIYFFSIKKYLEYMELQSNVIYSLIMLPHYCPTIMRDNHFIAQQPEGDPRFPCLTNITNNYFENYADFYPEAVHDGCFWNIPFGRFANATCKSPLKNTPAIPILSYETNLEHAHENLTNIYGYDPVNSEGRYIELKFNSADTAYYQIYNNGSERGTTTDNHYRFFSPDVGEYNFRVQAINETGRSGLSNTIKIKIVKFYEAEPDNTPIIINVLFLLGGAVCAVCIITIAKSIKNKNKNKKEEMDIEPEVAFE